MIEILIDGFLFFGMLVITLKRLYGGGVTKTSEALWQLFCWALVVLMGLHVVDLLHAWLAVHHPQILNW